MACYQVRRVRAFGQWAGQFYDMTIIPAVSCSAAGYSSSAGVEAASCGVGVLGAA